MLLTVYYNPLQQDYNKAWFVKWEMAGTFCMNMKMSSHEIHTIQVSGSGFSSHWAAWRYALSE
jgi:hypothetical protein